MTNDLNNSQDNIGVLLLATEMLCKVLVQDVHSFALQRPVKEKSIKMKLISIIISYKFRKMVINMVGHLHQKFISNDYKYGKIFGLPYHKATSCGRYA